MRIYGSTDHGLFNRAQEVQRACSLASKGFGAEVLHTFEEGRVEAWIHGRAPSNEDMRSPECMANIAAKLRSMHDRTGLNHNDLHRNNMIVRTGGELEFLDFEYTGPADPTYDIANHFNEWMYPYNGENPHLFQLGLYPRLSQRRDFVTHYLGFTGGGKGAVIDDFVEQVEGRRLDSHRFWVNWAERSGPSEFNKLYAKARRTLIPSDHFPDESSHQKDEWCKPTDEVFQGMARTFSKMLQEAPTAAESEGLRHYQRELNGIS